ncbi:uncharacterized protein LOC143022586 [Oratosquilla oratoria]|uniref:uncharacterized protein LOC143022586 n=1 Tax=Oratosquilla oratoria TaxID=337810 RepID=UPI003F761744
MDQGSSLRDHRQRSSLPFRDKGTLLGDGGVWRRPLWSSPQLWRHASPSSAPDEEVVADTLTVSVANIGRTEVCSQNQAQMSLLNVQRPLLIQHAGSCTRDSLETLQAGLALLTEASNHTEAFSGKELLLKVNNF